MYPFLLVEQQTLVKPRELPLKQSNDAIVTKSTRKQSRFCPDKIRLYLYQSLICFSDTTVLQQTKVTF